MSSDESRMQREHLAAASDRAASQVDLGWARHGRRRAEPGDLYVLSATSELPIEWALLDRHPDQPQLFLAVPADTCPHAGRADLVIPASGAGGPLTLRCRARVWLHERNLDPDLYTGSLDAGAIEKARELVHQVSERKIAPGPEEARPAYRDWILEVIAPAQTAVGTLAPHSPPSRQPTSFHRFVAAAAIILLGGSTLGMAGWALWQQGRIARLSQERAAAEEQVTREREQLTREHERSASLQRQLAAALREQERMEREHREDVPSPLVNLPLAFLDPVGALRGDAEPLRLPPEAPFLVVVLQLPEEADDSAYRLTLLRRDSGAVIWRSDPSPSAGPDEIHLSLPRHLLSPGAFRLRLHGLRNGRERRLADYDLLIAR